MISSDERNELLRDASSLAYQAIRFTGLYKELSSTEWDGLANEYGNCLVVRLEQMIDTEMNARQSEREHGDA